MQIERQDLIDIFEQAIAAGIDADQPELIAAALRDVARSTDRVVYRSFSQDCGCPLTQAGVIDKHLDPHSADDRGPLGRKADYRSGFWAVYDQAMAKRFGLGPKTVKVVG